ncbi:CusA/CzcA family heavy metal efflux RND transporter [Siphonobacter sp. SORGH_AS_0500]|uniref:CusA/CzcA family heavy metal efflux RND transporter n=1 Tax=Siphonobacter sp. SORGH_AS_0500 TaxID=1864824 RepID=UPI00285B77A4|nr:CusA/CzcA family heavy metal efflux RND transporter [Siphonobacter sp. SORGH_AS_0500]MDR6197692.1 cobalt-zinc-cadmium resistance protein CzcA [Siphonobacter sp. SORGH_AS_0500]
MLQALIGFSIRNKLVVAIGVLAIMAWGGYALTQIPIDANPDITNNQVQVVTQSSSLAAQEMEQFITFPLETSLRNIPGVTEIRSVSRFGLSVITVVFEDDVDLFLARQLVSEKLKESEAALLSGGSSPQMAPITTGLGEIYQYVLRPAPGYEAEYDATQLRTIQDWIVKRQLAGVAGVVEVSSMGGFLKQYEVSVNPDQLRAHDVTMAELFTALSLNNANTGGSYIEKGSEAFFIRGEGMVHSAEEIGQIVIKTINQTPLLVADVANVRIGHAVRYGAMTQNGTGEVVGGIVMMLKGASSEKTIKGVKARMEEVRKTLPKGLVLEPFLDRTVLIDKAIHTVAKNLIEGGLIVIVVLLVLLGNLRAGLIVASVIPLCMLFALGMMNTFGVSANLMSLGAIDFGLLVDGAVIIIEGMIFYLVHHQGVLKEQMDDVAQQSAERMMQSALFGQLIILIVYFPILSLTGIEGKMFRPMALTVGFALLGAMILCITYIPMMAAAFLKPDTKESAFSEKIMHGLHRLYDPLIRKALRFRAVILGLSLVLLGISVWVFTRMGGEFIPNLDEGDLAISLTLKPGSSLSQTVETTTKVEKILKTSFPEVETVVSKIGTAEIPTDPMPIEAADIMVRLKEPNEWVTTHDKAVLVEKMKAALETLPGLNLEFTQPIQLRFNELMTGVKSDVAIKIYGEDLDTLHIRANQIAGIIHNIDGVSDIKVEQIVGLPQMLVSYNRARLAQYGVNVSALNQVIKTAFAGETAGVVFEGEKRFDLVVRLDSSHRQDITDIRQIYVDLPNGNQVPLEELASVRYSNAPMQISRDNARRRITIGMNVRGRDVESLIGEIQQVLSQKVKLPPNYSITYGGQFENLVKAKSRLMVAVPVSLLLIFVLLFFTFGSVRQALMIYSAIPLSAIGGIWALELRGLPFSISAGVGFIALFGIAVLNGIVLISYFNQLKQEGHSQLFKRILLGTSVRFRPVVMTAAVASLGFLPMALSTTAGAEVQRPLATVVIGGLVSATLLTLVVLPILYSYLDRSVKVSKKGSVVMSLLLVSLLSSFPTQAQKLTLDQALTQALERNQHLQSAGVSIQVQEKLRRSAFDIPKTSLDYQRGQIQGANRDYTFNAVQSFALPGLYQSQRRFQEAQVDLAQKNFRVTKNELMRQVKLSYYHLLVLYARQAVLQQQDSVFTKAAFAANVRLRTGESNRLEQITAQARQRDIRTQIRSLQSQIKIARQALGIYLQQPEGVEIDTSQSLRITPNPKLSILAENNPELQLLASQQQSEERRISVEKNRLLPDLRLGYLNQSFERKGGFQAVQVGVSLPIVSGWYKSRIEAARLSAQATRIEYEYQASRLTGLASINQQEVLRTAQNLEYYTATALPQANFILANAEKSYVAGEIEYVEFVQASLQAWQIKEEYLNQVAAYNQAVIELESLVLPIE